MCGDVGLRRRRSPSVPRSSQGVSDGKKVGCVVPTDVASPSAHADFKDRIGRSQFSFPVTIKGDCHGSRARRGDPIMAGIADGSVDIVSSASSDNAADRLRFKSSAGDHDRRPIGVEHKRNRKSASDRGDVLTMWRRRSRARSKCHYRFVNE